MEHEALKLALEALENMCDAQSNPSRRNFPTIHDFGLAGRALRAIKEALAQPAQEEKKMYVDRIMCGVSRAEWHDRAWELYQAKAFDDCMLPKNVSIHTLRTIFNATYDSFGKDAIQEALAQLAQEPVCDKDPQGCWNVRCQLGKQCKNLAQPAQEPVAWTTMPEAEDWCFVSGNKDPNGKLEGKWFPLYTIPPQREWNAALDEAAARIGEIKGFGKATQDSFAVYIRGLKR